MLKVGFFCAILIVLISGLGLSQTALAGWTFWRKGGGQEKDSLSLDIGAQYWVHYNLKRTAGTPPSTVLGCYQLIYWLQGSFGIYATADWSVAQAKTSVLGVGVKFSVVEPPSQGAGVSVFLVGDYARYNTDSPDSNLYPAMSYLFRYGGGVNWFLGSRKFYLNTLMMVTIISNNFFIGPKVGIGLSF